jgi:dTDP-4-amino-4,6-dideoxygalactose transaminase
VCVCVCCRSSLTAAGLFSLCFFPLQLRYLLLKLRRLEDRSKGRKAAVDAIFRSLAQVNGPDVPVHVTHTYFWIQLVDLALHLPEASLERQRVAIQIGEAEARHVRELKQFLAQQPFLLNGGLVSQYYSMRAVFSPKAASEFVLPDLKALPSILSLRS